MVLSWDLLSLHSPWLNWKGVAFKRLLLGDFFLRAKRRDFEAGWGQRCPQAGEVCANHRELESSLALLQGSRDTQGLQEAGSWELGVFPEDLCHEGGHVSLFGVVQGKERVFLPMRPKTTSADT